MATYKTDEHRRLDRSRNRDADWKNWGTYLSERAWGTVREDYSPDGEAWHHFPFDHAHSRTYRWNEDGIGGFCNRFQNICLAVALWNGQDRVLKERLFGLSGPQGNHGEDVKEYYYYLDATPTHSYAKMLYKYPQVAFPYDELVKANQQRSRDEPEYELIDELGDVFAEGRYFDVMIEYAKADEEDILCRITAINRGPDDAPLHILPHVWFRNSWSWGYDRDKPWLRIKSNDNASAIQTNHRYLGDRWWYATAETTAKPEVLFTENNTNRQRIFGIANQNPHVKDSINDAVVHGRYNGIHNEEGTKAAAHIRTTIPAGGQTVVYVRYANKEHANPFANAEDIFAQRIEEADAFYNTVHAPGLSDDERRVQRQAFAGLLWTKQFYHYSVEKWLRGDPAGPKPPSTRLRGRNHDWTHLYNLDVLSMPDAWEYPWYAAWDLAFHMVPLALIDPEWSKRQLILLTREWYMHPNGQLPAYEWKFDDVNPPVHAWAAWRVYKITRNVTGHADTVFLEKIFHKMLLNFTWWVNRKDTEGNNIFQGGFLGLDNIGVFDRSKPLPTGGHMDQADGTAWMGMYCLNMLAMALELAKTKPAYEDVATKFFEHFIYIARAINDKESGLGLWDEEDGFYYDRLHLPGDVRVPLKLKSLVGLIPLFAVETLEPETLEQLPRFRRRANWFIKYRPELMRNLSLDTEGGMEGRYLLSLVNEHQLRRVLDRMLDPAQFLSDYGLRSLSKEHESRPYVFHVGHERHEVRYEPAESSTPLFGGNSNWRGPVWFPVNYLMIESLEKFHHFYGDTLKVGVPSTNGASMSLNGVARELAARLNRIFLRNEQGHRPFNGSVDLFQNDPHFRDHLLFYEYFHGDNGAGIGASHQTGWTALVAKLLQG